jgi:maleylacetate reductase
MTQIPTFALRLSALRVQFGQAAAPAIAAALQQMSLSRAVLLATPGHGQQARAIAAQIGPSVVAVLPLAQMHTPVEVTQHTLPQVLAAKADALISFGGGSVTGLGKALALHTHLPHIAVPTTHAGSEVTGILGQTEAGRKTTMTDARLQPQVVIYDPRLIASLPAPITVTSALNAMAHAVEALYAPDRNPLTSTLALQGAQALITALPKVLQNLHNLQARADCQYGGFLCGLVLGQVGMGLHHKLCHTLGGSFGLPHAQTHAVILPYAVAYNEAAVPDLLAPLAGILNAETAGQGLYTLSQSLHAPQSLRDLGLAETDLDRAADLAVQSPYPNPSPLEKPALRALLQAAWAGDPPNTRGYHG